MNAAANKISQCRRFLPRPEASRLARHIQSVAPFAKIALRPSLPPRPASGRSRWKPAAPKAGILLLRGTRIGKRGRTRYVVVSTTSPTHPGAARCRQWGEVRGASRTRSRPDHADPASAERRSTSSRQASGGQRPTAQASDGDDRHDMWPRSRGWWTTSPSTPSLEHERARP